MWAMLHEKDGFCCLRYVVNILHNLSFRVFFARCMLMTISILEPVSPATPEENDERDVIPDETPRGRHIDKVNLLRRKRPAEQDEQDEPLDLSLPKRPLCE